MKSINPIPWQVRLKELGYDYLLMLGYLLLLFICTMLFYTFILGGIPEYDLHTVQLIPTVFGVIPIIVIFSIMDYHGGSWGKRKTGLQLFYQSHTFYHSLIRNVIKFLPWQLGHMSTIRGLYVGYDAEAIILFILSMGLLFSFFAMGFLRQDKRHLPDLIAGTQVQLIE